MALAAGADAFFVLSLTLLGARLGVLSAGLAWVAIYPGLLATVLFLVARVVDAFRAAKPSKVAQE